MKQRIEEFTMEEKQFLYFDLSEFKTNDEYAELIEAANGYMVKYAEKSIYTITNIRDVKFDTETKKIIAKWMEHNKPYVKYGAVIGFDGIKRMVVNLIFKMSGRKNMTFATDKEAAIKWLLER